MNYNPLQKPNRHSRYKQGFFNPRNPKKYVGDVRNIVYRSGYELKFMTWADENPGIISWSSEETVIPYISPVDDRYHRYFIDFKVVMNTKEGQKTVLFEVKPEKQMSPPTKGKKVTKSYIKESVTFAINEAKWNSAKEYCKKRGWEFAIINEYDLGIKSR